MMRIIKISKRIGVSICSYFLKNNLLYHHKFQHRINFVVDILMDGKLIQIGNKMELLRLKEVSNLTVRGMSKIIGVPIMITFYNQLQALDVNVAGMTEEFQTADYQKFNMSMGQSIWIVLRLRCIGKMKEEKLIRKLTSSLQHKIHNLCYNHLHIDTTVSGTTKF